MLINTAPKSISMKFHLLLKKYDKYLYYVNTFTPKKVDLLLIHWDFFTLRKVTNHMKNLFSRHVCSKEVLHWYLLGTKWLTFSSCIELKFWNLHDIFWGTSCPTISTPSMTPTDLSLPPSFSYPSLKPTISPSFGPEFRPSITPTKSPSTIPTQTPSIQPTYGPTRNFT